MISTVLLLALAQGELMATPHGATWLDVSEYMLGRVYVKAYFVESNGPNEDWTQDEKDMCQRALENALAWLESRFDAILPAAPADAKLVFTADYETVNVSMEPMEMNGGPGDNANGGGAEEPWVQEIMDAKGYSNYTSTRHNVAAHNHDLRVANGADWAITIFFLDSSADADGRLPNGNRALYAAGIGGPYVVIQNSFPDSSKDLEDVPSAAAHEIMHLFYAVDEYQNYHYRLDAHMGYLNGYNDNYDADNDGIGALGEECLMLNKGMAYAGPCTPHLKQIGWTDSDGDSIPDILDVDPTVVLNPPSENPTSNPTPTFTGSASSPALPNQNPYQEGASVPGDNSVVLHLTSSPPVPWTRNDITLNDVTGVEYRILDSSGTNVVADWTPATPNDGAFDSNMEDFTFTCPALADGTYFVEARSMNSAGLTSALSSQQVTVATTTTCTTDGECDDGNPCTDDVCQSGTCAHPGKSGATCDDGDPCTDPDQCNAGGQCIGGPNVCQDGGTDAGTDAGADAGLDAGVDAGLDAGQDAGADAGSDPGRPDGDGGEKDGGSVEEQGGGAGGDNGSTGVSGSCGCGAAGPATSFWLLAFALTLGWLRRR